MSHRNVSRFLPAASSVAFACLLFLPAPAHGQLGSIVKKAKEAVANNAQGNTSAGRIPADAFGPELDEGTLGAVIRGLDAVATKRSERDALRAEDEKTASKIQTIRSSHEADQKRYDDATANIRACQEPILEQRRKANQTKAASSAMAMQQDPQESIRYAQAMQAAMAKGDTATASRLGREHLDAMMKRAGVDFHADTAEANRVCGAPPGRPAWMTELDQLSARQKDLDEQVRQKESESTLAGVTASGLKADRFGAGRERVLHWYNGMKSKSPIQAFSDRERKLFEAHSAEIERVSKAL